MGRLGVPDEGLPFDDGGEHGRHHGCHRGLEQADRYIGVERRGCRGIEACLLHPCDASERDSAADLEAG